MRSVCLDIVNIIDDISTRGTEAKSHQPQGNSANDFEIVKFVPRNHRHEQKKVFRPLMESQNFSPAGKPANAIVKHLRETYYAIQNSRKSATVR